MYERLQSEATALNIEVQEKVMVNRIKGLYGDNVIWINKKIETSTEKACVLAEEIGHHHLTEGDIIDQTKITNRKQELLARKWAYKKLVPLNKLVECFKNAYRERFEIAEYLNVTERFLDECLKFYREKYGTHVKVDDFHILFFDPLTVYERRI